MGANNDTSFLEQMNGGGWRVVVNIPAKYQDVIGKKKLKQSLGTDSLTEANRRKWPIVNHFKSQISSVSRNALGDIGTARALTLRAKLQAAVLVPMHGQEDSEAEMVAWEIADEAEALQGQPIGTDEHGQPIFDPKREAGAQIFYEVAKGKRTPLMLPAEDFRRQKDESWQGKTWGKFDKITKELEGWLIKRRGVATLEHVDRRAVGEFIASMLKDHGWKHKTLNGYISALSQYWLWLEKRGLVQSNPWQGQGLKEPPKKDVDRERAFNADEMQRLLNGSPNQPYLSDLIRIGALTGARLGSLIELTVGACKNGVFVIPAGKKERQHREV
ncbi:MAG: hypothetical protein OEY05_05455, partial [Paracoccaceae bacterium]|nr:hypothetical protein [Paracoccaceae bacterium]